MELDCRGSGQDQSGAGETLRSQLATAIDEEGPEVRKRCLALVLCPLLLGQPALAEWVSLPAGTVVYGELQQQVTSRKKDWAEGDLVQAIVWRDVSVKGDVVIEAGTPMVLKVSKIKKSNFAGVKGKLELRAFSTTAVEGTEVPLVGGYDKSGKGRKALAISLAAIIFVPLIFIKGKHAVLEAGTIFDAQVQGNTDLEMEAEAPRRTISLQGSEGLEVEVLYDEVPDDEKLKLLPLRLELCGDSAETASVVSVNDQEIEPIEIALSEIVVEDECASARGQVSLEELGKHFRRGINRFDVKFGSRLAEVILEVEL